MPRITKTLAQRFRAKVMPSNGCLLWTGSITRDGYGQICEGGRHGKMLRAHHVAWFLAFGVWPKYLCHTCDIPRCVYTGHLFEGNSKINAADRHAKGRTAGATLIGLHPKGEQVNTAKLTADQVQHIRKLYDAGASVGQLAELFSMSKTPIRRIAKREGWKHIT